MTPDYMSTWYSGCLSQAIWPEWFDKSRIKLHLRLLS